MSPDASAVRRTRASMAAWIPSVRVVTYNIHSCVGVDRRYDPSRISTVLREIDADIACLQEVDARRRSERHADQWAYLGVATGCRVVTGTGVCQPRLRFGNAILSRFPVLAARLIDLTVAGHEPRGGDRCGPSDRRASAAGHRHPFWFARRGTTPAGEPTDGSAWGTCAGESAQGPCGAADGRSERMAGATGCDPFARSKSRPECGRAHVPIMDAGAGARQNLCRWTGGAP